MTLFRSLVGCGGLALGLLMTSTARADVCEVPDNGSGTVDLPPQGCGYVSPQDLHIMIDGLPPGTEIHVAAEHMKFFQVQTQPGGNLGGEIETFQSFLSLNMTGTGDLAGFGRNLNVQVQCQVHTGPRNPGDPVQEFPNEMFFLQGEIFGDPDFDLLRITAGQGTGGPPSPGGTRLTRLENGNWNVDSFFDITYQIEFVGAPGSALDGLGGATTAPVLMVAGEPIDPPVLCPTDIDGDGDTDVDDLIAIILAWGPCPIVGPCPADVNNDGIVNVDDLIAVILAWGPCPSTCPPLDYFATIPDQPTFVSFIDADLQPIPADFFGPGSDPFFGEVQLRGVELDPTFPLVDTVVQRLPLDLVDDPLGTVATTPVQLIELNLTGIAPIIVTTAGGTSPQPWIVAMGLSDGQQEGQMTATKTHATGGTVDAVIPVKPRLIFAREQDVQQLAAGILTPDDVQVRIIDFDIEGRPPIDMHWDGLMPFSTSPPTDGGFFCPGETFFPGVNSEGGLATPTLPPHVPPSSQGAAHFVCPPPPPPPGLCTYTLLGTTRCIGGAPGVLCPIIPCPAPAVVKCLLVCPAVPAGCPAPCPPFIAVIVPCPGGGPGCFCVAFYTCAGCLPC